jgi:hypothetical protein
MYRILSYLTLLWRLLNDSVDGMGRSTAVALVIIELFGCRTPSRTTREWAHDCVGIVGIRGWMGECR